MQSTDRSNTLTEPVDPYVAISLEIEKCIHSLISAHSVFASNIKIGVSNVQVKISQTKHSDDFDVHVNVTSIPESSSEYSTKTAYECVVYLRDTMLAWFDTNMGIKMTGFEIDYPHDENGQGTFISMTGVMKKPKADTN